MRGLLAYSAYVPYWRLPRSRIADALGQGSPKGARSVASYDEDSTSMGVEAARAAMHAAPPLGASPDVLFATTTPAYADKTNATAIHAALGLDVQSAAWDLNGSVRSGAAAMRFGAEADARLVVLSDMRNGQPGSADEGAGGDGAAALLFGAGPAIVETLGWAHASAEFLDRWRLPGAHTSSQWEERFGEDAYRGVAEQAFEQALKSAGLQAEDLDVLIVAGLHARAVRQASSRWQVRSVAPDLAGEIGNTGVAHGAIALADVLDRAAPGQTVALLTLSDGADAWIGRTTEVLADHSRAPSVRSQIETGNDSLSYPSFLTWRGHLHREPPRRPDPARPAGPPAARAREWKFGFVGSTCVAPTEDGSPCNTRHLPPSRICVRCDAVDQMELEGLGDVKGTIVTFTVDNLAFSLNPPTIVAVIDFDGGGRFQGELTDAAPDEVHIGQRVEMTFRRLFSADGVHNYFWKARPVRQEGAS